MAWPPSPERSATVVPGGPFCLGANGATTRRHVRMAGRGCAGRRLNGRQAKRCAMVPSELRDP